ncbi:MAG: glucose-6-phosphate dehydrogenase [Candidatus Levybacteria bacterium RIFCSPLOWO2_01_FULL_38_13]|nr:MAG: glucose-6-phosphate dehydrogenase [Candidatus Levybacteria bacterium RIFCSPHIGHO2_01_FULL_41_15]OGH35075.1 MAG: glucose-6-phosphate dehydrogenase [Candidatus Levybacteria bacterium RIFCSPLOWO2_01_FULL_38_13]
MNSPFVMIIFGGTGDLAQNKLIPALFSLFNQNFLPKDFFIIGFSRRDYNDDEFRDFFKELSEKPNWREFSNHLYYQKGDFTKEEGYKELIEKLNAFDKKMGACITRFFYLATPPENYEAILDYLQSTELAEGCGQGSNKWTRLIIEKPFGKDLETAISLDKKLSKIFEEKQIFRVDHYLGKETVQNMLAFRFANGIFEPVWNKNFIDHVQITFSEKKGIEERGQFFDGVGILRDVGQNHLMQLIAGVGMEMPRSFTKEDLRDARANVIKAIRCIEPDEVSGLVVRGQYEDYKDEKNVSSDSQTETFAAFKFFIETPRFEGVPFYVRAGKKMPKDEVTISIVFLQTCHILFKEYGCPEIGNVLTIRIQPDEGIYLRVIAKKPGSKLALETVNMLFTYEESFKTKGLEAYEKILIDIFNGDQMLFNRSDELANSWDFITKILKGWEKEGEKGLKTYKPETWGPKEAQELIERDGRKWL